MEKEKPSCPHTGHRLKLKKRFLLEGLDHFEDHNILELILFFALPRCDTNEIAHALLSRFGTLSRVFEADVKELAEVSGIGPHAAVLLKTYPAVAKRYYMDRFRPRKKLATYQMTGREMVLQFAGLEHEQVYVQFYDNALNYIDGRVMHNGDINSVAFSFRKLCNAALSTNASYVILAHNHPHGLPIASAEDMSTTSAIKRFLLTMNVILIDHFIVAEDHFCSLERETYQFIYNEFKQNAKPLPDDQE